MLWAIMIPGGVAAGGSISGAVGGNVFTRNRFGQVLRTRVTPVNPSTLPQQEARARFSQFSQRWTNVLTELQREAWRNYGAAVSVINKIGLAIKLTGQNWYVAMNTFREQAGLAIVDDAPTTFTKADFTAANISSADPGVPEISVSFDASEAWANEVGGAMNLYVSRPQNLSIQFFNGPFQYLGTILGDDAVPPVSPSTFTSPFPFASGTQLFLRSNVCRADGRISTPAIDAAEVA